MTTILYDLKGRTTLSELNSLPNRIVHTLYYKHYLLNKNREAQEKNAKAKGGEEMLEQMEEMTDGGMI